MTDPAAVRPLAALGLEPGDLGIGVQTLQAGQLCAVSAGAVPQV